MNLIEDHTQDISAGIRKENEDNNESYKCNICSKSLHSFSLLENHVERFHKTQRHNCDQCERTFQGKIPLQNHILQAHTSVKTFDCKHCGQSLSKKTKSKSAHSNFSFEGKAKLFSMYPMYKSIQNSRFDN